MPPSSLIFVVILAVWAAYLVQHWVKRRDHIATARSVDRFSEAMRVLERRQRMPQADLSRPVPRSYAVSPARPAAPDVMVKRAAPVPRPAAVAGPRARPARHTGSVRLPAVRPAAVRRSWSPVADVRGRAATLLAAVMVMVLGVVLGVSGLTPLWTAAAGTAVLAGAVIWLRRAAKASVRHSGGPAVPAGSPRTEPAGTRRTETAGSGVVPRAAATPSITSRASTAVYDIDVVEARRPPGAAADSDGGAVPAPVIDAPGTWRPVPVPPPTYTLKAKATPRHTDSDPAATTDGDTRSEAVTLAAVSAPAPARRPSSGELPFDGRSMSFDEEFEDLPAVHSL